MVLDKGLASVRLLLDLSAALCIENHNFLLQKFECVIGNKEKILNWFKNYLYYRF